MLGSSHSDGGNLARRSRLEPIALTLMRIGIGWHFSYEGLSKLFEPGWTSAGYLQSAGWIGADVFHWMAANESILRAVDLLNAWGLLLIGVALILGCLTRLAAVLGVLLLALYYIAHPSLFGPSAGVSEGSYLLINKNLVEALALCVIAVRPANHLGLDGALFAWYKRRWRKPAGTTPDRIEPLSGQALSRRQVLASLTGVPFVGAFALAVLKKRGYVSREETGLVSRIDAISAPSMKAFRFETLDDLKGKVPTAKIGDREFSRVILGGNLMNGFAHARDLIYVSKLIKAYHTQERVFATLKLAEDCGINTILTNPILAPIIEGYWDQGVGNIQFIAQCKGKTEEELLDCVRYSIDQGACAAYIQGAAADSIVSHGKLDWIESALDLIRESDIPAGIGGHYLQTIMSCVEVGFEPDFWMKTLHHHKYWSADVVDQHDNIWCEEPDQTIAFMEQLPQPWIAFKVLAAGSIHPKQGFRYAFEAGADFICVGMYDFQVVEDANIAFDVLEGKLRRRRPWYA